MAASGRRCAYAGNGASSCSGSRKIRRVCNYASDILLFWRWFFERDVGAISSDGGSDVYGCLWMQYGAKRDAFETPPCVFDNQ